MRNTRILAVFAVALSCALGSTESAQAGDVYKYVDVNGTTLYTDKPIPGAVLVSTGSQRPPDVAARNYSAAQAANNGQLSASNQRIADSKTDARAASTVAKDLEASRAERCKKAREFYQSAINSQRLYRTTADGKREYLDDTEIAQKRVDAAKAVDSICGPQG